MTEIFYGEILDLLRDQRHDFLNHLQVIMGNLQLKKADRAENYCRQVTSQILSLGSLTKMDNPYLSLSLMLLLQRAKSLDIDLKIGIEPGISYDELATESSDIFRNLVETCMRWIEKTAPGANWLQLNLRANSGDLHWELKMAPLPEFADAACALQEELSHEIKADLEFSQTAEAAMIVFRLPRAA